MIEFWNKLVAIGEVNQISDKFVVSDTILFQLKSAELSRWQHKTLHICQPCCSNALCRHGCYTFCAEGLFACSEVLTFCCVELAFIIRIHR